MNTGRKDPFSTDILPRLAIVLSGTIFWTHPLSQNGSHCLRESSFLDDIDPNRGFRLIDGSHLQREMQADWGQGSEKVKNVIENRHKFVREEFKKYKRDFSQETYKTRLKYWLENSQIRLHFAMILASGIAEFFRDPSSLSKGARDALPPPSILLTRPTSPPLPTTLLIL